MNERIERVSPQLCLRFAEEADLPRILAFIRALADYENLSHEVTADEAALRASLFSKEPAAEVVMADYLGEPAGFALFFMNFSTFLGRPGIYLEDLFVAPERRGRGIGRALLRFLGRLALERGCARLEWSVLDWNEPAIRFYKRLGAEALAEWTVFRLTGSALRRLARDA